MLSDVNCLFDWEFLKYDTSTTTSGVE